MGIGRVVALRSTQRLSARGPLEVDLGVQLKRMTSTHIDL